MKRFLSDVWPEGEQIKVFAFLETQNERTPLLWDYSNSEEAQKVVAVYKNYQVNDIISAGTGLLYIYLDGSGPPEEDYIDLAQTSLF